MSKATKQYGNKVAITNIELFNQQAKRRFELIKELQVIQTQIWALENRLAMIMRQYNENPS